MESALQQEEQLSKGLNSMDCRLDGHQTKQFLDYLRLLHKWNKAYNLTAVRDPALHVNRHILDSLAIRPFLKGNNFLDVGSGAGLPGVPIAIVEPSQRWALLDSNGKKTRFLTQCKLNLSLPNVEVFQERIETAEFDQFIDRSGSFDGIVSRAFASLKDMVEGCEHVLQKGTLIYAMKGVKPEEEIAELPYNYKVLETHRLNIPDCDGERHLIIIAPKSVAGEQV